ncbi:hypothetical protein AB7M33_004214 [Pseudomonas sp. Y3 TE3536]
MTTTVPTPEMHQAKKGNPYFFGMKVHIGAKVEGVQLLSFKCLTTWSATCARQPLKK